MLFERIPAALMGRVTSMNLAMSWSLIPLGGLLGGLLVAGFGISPALLVIGGLLLRHHDGAGAPAALGELDDRPADDGELAG